MGEATVGDLESIPEGKNGEIVAGELLISSRPLASCAYAGTGINLEIFGAFHMGKGGPGGWWILREPEIRMGNDVLIPDYTGWHRERIQKLPESHFTLVPDWVCELVSPATARLDLVKKLPAYARHGVQHAWIVKPAYRLLQVYRLIGEHWALVASYTDDDMVRAEPFEAIEFNLGILWVPA